MAAGPTESILLACETSTQVCELPGIKMVRSWRESLLSVRRGTPANRGVVVARPTQGAALWKIAPACPQRKRRTRLHLDHAPALNRGAMA